MAIPQGISKDTRWREPYASWTLADLLIANYLRPTPLPLSDITLFQKHKLASVRQIRSNLRSSGRLTPDHQVNRDHPDFLAIASTPKALPLPDPGSRPAHRRTAAQQTAVAEAVRATSDGSKLTRDRAAAILANLITSGQAGENIHRYIDTWLQTAPTGTSGPPPPLTPTQIHDRLLTLLLASPEATVRRAITSWEARLADSEKPGGPLLGTPPHVQGPPPQDAEDHSLHDLPGLGDLPPDPPLPSP